MKRLVLLLLAMVFVLTSVALADDVYVKGYFRKDGTYVRPHIRSSPDGYKWNNYGPSQRDTELMNPWLRDADRDGTPNYLDLDDDNDGLFDDSDWSQY